MSAIVVPDGKLQTNSTEDVSTSPSLAFQTIETKSTLDERVHQRRGSGFSGTSLENEIIQNIGSGPLSAERIYPHIFDENVKAGQALVYIRSALNDAREAVDAFGEPDLQSVGTRLTQISVAMSKAYPDTDFNESLGAVVSFIRRATLIASGYEVSRSALNSLVNVLGQLTANPMLDLDDASDIVDMLTNDGWQGQHRLVDEMVKILMDNSDLDTEDLQALLFPGS